MELKRGRIKKDLVIAGGVLIIVICGISYIFLLDAVEGTKYDYVPWLIVCVLFVLWVGFMCVINLKKIFGRWVKFDKNEQRKREGDT